MKTKGQIVRQWREARRMNARELGEAVETSRQNIENLEADLVDQPRYLRRLAKLMGYASVEQLLELQEPPANSAIELRTEHVPSVSVAHKVSDLDVRVPPKRRRVEWRDTLDENDLPPQFEVRMPNDDLAGIIERGEWLICSRTAPPRANKAVLVVDQAGKPYVRRYEEAAAGKWYAVSTMPGRRDLAGDVDVRLVAVVLGNYYDEES